MSLKQEVLSSIKNLLAARVETARKAMNEAQAAANEEGKSSAGDKYETGRAMAQNLRDMNALQLSQALAALESFEKIAIPFPSDKIRAGSLIQTQENWYFLGAGLGKMETPTLKNLFALSLSAPLGQAFLGKKPGQEVQFMGKTLTILSVL